MTLDTCLRGLVLAALAPVSLAGFSAGDLRSDEIPIRVLEPVEIFDLEYASEPQIAPDGSLVVYVRNFMDVNSDRRRSNLWVVETLSQTPIPEQSPSQPDQPTPVKGTYGHWPLTSGSANHSSPRWSPDGKRLAWISNEGGSSQIHVRWMDSGATASITRLDHAPSNLTWSRDSQRLAFTAFVPRTQKPFIEMPASPEGAEWAAPARVITDYLYRDDGGGYREPGNVQLFVVPADGNAPQQWTADEFDCGAPSWTPDGKLVFSATPDEEESPLDSELYRVDQHGRVVTLIKRNGPDLSPAVSPDGSRIAYIGGDDLKNGYLPNRLWVSDSEGNGPRCVTIAFDRDLASPTWSADGQGVFVSYSDRGNTKIAFVEVSEDADGDGGQPAVITDYVGGTSIGRPYSSGSFSVSQTDQVAFTLTHPHHPADVAISERGQFGKKRLTELNADLLGPKVMAEVVELKVQSELDELPIQTWLALPPGFDEASKYPLILEIHGGPFANYGDRFAAEIQLYAAAGYLVLYCNPRGSTSYGVDFANLIHHQYPGLDYDDLMSAVRVAKLEPYVDADRLFVTGGSGGGVLTAWIVGKTDEFKAAVVAKPVINWISFVLTADAYNYFSRYWFPGPPWENLEHYWERSPLSLVASVTTPTMLLTGEEDYRTPISESEQFYQALKMRDVDAAFVRIPGAGHGIAARPSNLISKVLHVLAWFEQHDLPSEEER